VEYSSSSSKFDNCSLLYENWSKCRVGTAEIQLLLIGTFPCYLQRLQRRHWGLPEFVSTPPWLTLSNLGTFANLWTWRIVQFTPLCLFVYAAWFIFGWFFLGSRSIHLCSHREHSTFRHVNRRMEMVFPLFGIENQRCMGSFVPSDPRKH